jgi:hypothetical protein
MTGKQAVKARCRDCIGGKGDCAFTDCVLKGMAKGKGKVKAVVIKAYCRWCLNGHQFSACASPDCAIYQFRNEREAWKIPRIREETGGTEGGFESDSEKPYTSGSKVKQIEKPPVCGGYNEGELEAI